MAKFKSLWYGDALSPYQHLAMRSFIDHGHDYALYTYSPLNVPAGVELRDASEILPKARVFFYGEAAGTGRGSVSAFSNLFRYHLLHEFGDWWVDADIICLSDKVPNTDIFLSWEYDTLIGTAILKFPARHEFVRQLRDEAERAGPDVAWGTIGPTLLTKVARATGVAQLATPHSFGYPVQSCDALHLFVPARRDEVQHRLAEKPFLHMWNEVLRRAVILPWMAPPEDSVLAELIARHKVSFEGARAYTADQIQRLNDNYLAAATWSHEEVQKAEWARLTARLHRSQSEVEALMQELSELCERVRVIEVGPMMALLRRPPASLEAGVPCEKDRFGH